MKIADITTGVTNLMTVMGTVLTFTFHYVSIKSNGYSNNSLCLNGFTFHYVSIKSIKIYDRATKSYIFTFHYVSIKSYFIFKHS